jgi:hypothetical protein
MIVQVAETMRNFNHASGGCLRILFGSLVLMCSANAQSNSNVFRDEGRQMAANNKDVENDASRDCTSRLMAFVQALDKLLASDPSTIIPVHELLNTYFPVEGCDIQTAIQTARRSRFFSHVSDQPTYYSIIFDSRGFAGVLDPGFHVQISLLKASGNSWLPAAHVNKLR